MKQEKKKIYIDQPCSEDWSKMTLEGEGRFCQHCSKTVIDFTHQSIDEIKAFFESNRGEICGYFLPLQLELINSEPPKSSPKWKAWLIAVSSLFTTTTLNSCSANSSTVNNTEESENINDDVISANENDEVVMHVRDKTNHTPLANAKVYVHKVDKRIKSDKHGKVVLSKDLFVEGVCKLTITKKGFMSEEVSLKLSNKINNIYMTSKHCSIRNHGIPGKVSYNPEK